MEKAKLATIFALFVLLALGMWAYWAIASSTNDLVLKGGFITLIGYLVKKVADQVDEIIDKLWEIEKKEEGTKDV